MKAGECGAQESVGKFLQIINISKFSKLSFAKIPAEVPLGKSEPSLRLQSDLYIPEDDNVLKGGLLLQKQLRE